MFSINLPLTYCCWSESQLQPPLCTFLAHPQHSQCSPPLWHTLLLLPCTPASYLPSPCSPRYVPAPEFPTPFSILHRVLLAYRRGVDCRSSSSSFSSSMGFHCGTPPISSRISTARHFHHIPCSIFSRFPSAHFPSSAQFLPALPRYRRCWYILPQVYLPQVLSLPPCVFSSQLFCKLLLCWRYAEFHSGCYALQFLRGNLELFFYTYCCWNTPGTFFLTYLSFGGQRSISNCILHGFTLTRWQTRVV